MKKIKAIDFFCGCGGLTHGMTLAGIDVVAGLDNDLSCKEAYEYNNPSKFIHQDIGAVKSQHIKNIFRQNADKDSYFLMAGCAPCQPYSHINKKKKKNDIREVLLEEFSRIVKGVRPHFVLMENVNTLTSQNIHFAEFIQMLKNCGYRYEYQTLNARHFSVAQNRKRLFLIASRVKKVNVSFDKIEKTAHVITLKDVIYQLETIEHNKPSRYDKLHRARILNEINLKRIRATPKNGGLRSAWSKDLANPCHKKQEVFLDNYGRLKWDDVSSTITTKFNQYYSGRFGHPEQDRALSLREGAMIQTFPQNYQFFGSDRQIARQIGNAVPINLAQAVSYLFIAPFLQSTNHQLPKTNRS